jgi:hypothetical protein
VYKLYEEAADGSLTETKGDGGELLGAAGTAWEIELGESGEPGQALLIETGGGGPVRDAAISGIDVQVPTMSKRWITVAHVQPRLLHESFVVDSLDASLVRLAFRGDCSIRRLARVDRGKVVSMSPLVPESVVHSQLGDGTKAIAAIDGTTMAVRGRQSMVLTYRLPPIRKDSKRDGVLFLRGSRLTKKTAAAATTATDARALPTAFALHQNQPNPFARITTIRFDLPTGAHVELAVFDLQGRKLRTLTSGEFAPGSQTVTWDQRDDAGSVVRPGVYLCRMEAGNFRAQRKMVLLP